MQMGHLFIRRSFKLLLNARAAPLLITNVVKRHIRDWSVDDVAQHLLRDDVNKVLVMAGAGISTPSGIPDFRSPGSGLYDNLQKYNLPYPEAIFDIDYFRSNPQPFYALARELYPGNFRPNRAHHFCALLNNKNKLLRMYTQNIDGLEQCHYYALHGGVSFGAQLSEHVKRV